MKNFEANPFLYINQKKKIKKCSSAYLKGVKMFFKLFFTYNSYIIIMQCFYHYCKSNALYKLG